jgi:hypothetical protein
MRVMMLGVLALIALSETACYTMKTVSLDDLTADRSSRVWVTHADESQIVVHDAQVFRGNLVGFVDGKYRELKPDDVQATRVRKLAPGKTLALVGAGAAGFVVAAVLLSGKDDFFDPCAGDEDCIPELRARY